MSDLMKVMTDAFSRYNKNPSSVIASFFDLVEANLNGDVIPNPTNPFTFLAAMNASSFTAYVAETKAAARKKYRRRSETLADLYQFMSEDEARGRFSLPANANLKLQIPEAELRRVAVPVPNSLGLSRIIMPRSASVTVNGYRLSPYYDLYIDVLEKGGIQCYWNTEDATPQDRALYATPGNIVTYQRLFINEQWVYILDVPLHQFAVSVQTFPLDNLSTFQKSIAYDNNFYTLRAYTDTGDDPNDPWVEIHTSHTFENYDSSKPTLLIEVLNSEISVYLPDIYMTNDLMGSSLRIHVYTTFGEVELPLGEFISSEFSYSWALINEDSAIRDYVTPWDEISSTTLFYGDSESRITGGRKELSFAELRDKLVYFMDENKELITPKQLETYFELAGYTLQRFDENDISRLYVASRHLPSRVYDSLTTPVDAMNAWVTAGMNRADLTTGTGNPICVFDNASRVTIRDNTLLLKRDGALHIQPAGVKREIVGLPINARVTRLNSMDYLYSPFTYCISDVKGSASVRVYDMHSPIVSFRHLAKSNENVGYSILTADKQLIPIYDTDEDVARLPNYEPVVGNTGVLLGYLIRLQVAHPDGMFDDGIRELVAQMAFNNRANVINGTLLNGTYGKSASVFEFFIDTNMDILPNGKFRVTSFEDPASSAYLDLAARAELYYIVRGNSDDNYSDPSTGVKGVLDTRYNPNVLTDTSSNWVCTTFEEMGFQFGTLLDGLYAPCRSIIKPEVFLTSDVDVQGLWPYDVPLPDPDNPGSFKFIPVNEGTEDETIELLYAAEEGDPMYAIDQYGNVTNTPIYKYRKGDLIRNEVTGEPIIVSPAELDLSIGLMAVDARYYFASTASAAEYRKTYIKAVGDYLRNDVVKIRDRIKQRSDIQYKPRGYPNTVAVYIGGGVELQIESKVDFTIRFYLTDAGFRNMGLRNSIEARTRALLSDVITRRSLSVSDIIDELKELAGADVKSIDMDRFGPAKDLPLMTLSDSGSSFVIGNSMVALSDGTIDVVDTVNITFIRANVN